MRACATTLEAEMAPVEHDRLVTALQELNLSEDDRVLEIGTAAGGTLATMMKAVNGNKAPQFVVVDPMTYFPNQLERVKENLTLQQLNPDAVDFRVGKSHELFEQAEQKNERFKFILVDGCHKLRYVTWDLKWLKLLSVNGVAFFHDYEPGSDVALAVDRFVKKNAGCYQIENLTRTLLCLRKTAQSTTDEVTQLDVLYANIRAPLLQIKTSMQKRINRLRESRI